MVNGPQPELFYLGYALVLLSFFFPFFIFSFFSFFSPEPQIARLRDPPRAEEKEGQGKGRDVTLTRPYCGGDGFCSKMTRLSKYADSKMPR